MQSSLLIVPVHTVLLAYWDLFNEILSEFWHCLANFVDYKLWIFCKLSEYLQLRGAFFRPIKQTNAWLNIRKKKTEDTEYEMERSSQPVNITACEDTHFELPTHGSRWEQKLRPSLMCTVIFPLSFSLKPIEPIVIYSLYFMIIKYNDKNIHFTL